MTVVTVHMLSISFFIHLVVQYVLLHAIHALGIILKTGGTACREKKKYIYIYMFLQDLQSKRKVLHMKK